MPHIIKPRCLKKGATIGIISPASPQRDPARLERGISYLENMGFSICIGKATYASWGGYLAGTDQQRKQDIEDMFANPAIDAIFCARGGYGTMRFLRDLNYDLIRANPKIFVGFSDTTALQCALFRHCGLISFSGAMPSVDMADGIDPLTEESLWSCLMEGHIITKQPEQRRMLVQGKAEGRFFCGNLTLLSALCGTDYLPDMKGHILAAEEIGEDPYRVDRLLAQLELAGILGSLSGLCFGQFTQSSSRQSASAIPQRSIQEVLQDYAIRSGRPAMDNLLYGHQACKLTLPFGIKAVIDSQQGMLEFTESCFQD
jgi:muramoyltetrapeptide carboxypeptidase